MNLVNKNPFIALKYLDSLIIINSILQLTLLFLKILFLITPIHKYFIDDRIISIPYLIFYILLISEITLAFIIIVFVLFKYKVIIDNNILININGISFAKKFFYLLFNSLFIVMLFSFLYFLINILIILIF